MKLLLKSCILNCKGSTYIVYVQQTNNVPKYTHKHTHTHNDVNVNCRRYMNVLKTFHFSYILSWDFECLHSIHPLLNWDWAKKGWLIVVPTHQLITVNKKSLKPLKKNCIEEYQSK